VAKGGNEASRFSEEFDDQFAVGPEEGNRAFFGRDVLSGLIEGIEDFAEERQPRWKQFRSLGPVLLGCTPWITDGPFIDALGKLAGACIVIRKAGRGPNELRKLEPLRALNERTPGLPIEAFAYLGGLAYKVDGERRVIGPYDRMGDEYVPTIRTIGYRTRGGSLLPMLHAKLALLGHMWWHDEGPLGHVEDVIGFKAKRLWISSANFTALSRLHLEFGLWTEDRVLVQGAEDFLLKLIVRQRRSTPSLTFSSLTWLRSSSMRRRWPKPGEST
jgi:hypothetical protein